MALPIESAGPVHAPTAAIDQAKEVVEEAETYEIAHGFFYTKEMMLKLITAAKAVKRVRDTDVLYADRAVAVLEPLMDRLQKRHSHACSRRQDGGCEVCTGIAEVMQGEGFDLDR